MSAAYPLAPLASVRRLRKDAAATEYTARKNAHLAACQETLARQKALDDYVIWRQEEEERRYLAILGKSMSIKDMADFKDALSTLREKDTILMESLALAHKAEDKAAMAAEKALSILQQTRKEQAKIDEHRKSWQIQEAMKNEWMADLEMEEFTGNRRL